MRRQGGFTVIELMVAVTILAGMMVIAFGATQRTMEAKRHYGDVQERYRMVRVAMNRIVRDLSMAYVSTNEDLNLQDRRTFFVGEDRSDIDELRFSTFSHTRLYADANESDETIVAYYGGIDPDDRRRKALFRREAQRQANEPWDRLPGQTDVLFSGLTSFRLEYWDVQEQEWEDSWSTVSADGKPNRVPDKVRITLSFEDERGKEVTFVTEARIHLQEALQFFTN